MSVTDTLGGLVEQAVSLPWPAYAAAGVLAGLAVLALLAGAVTRRTNLERRGEAAARWLTRLIGGSGVAVASYGVVMFLRDAGLPWLLAVLGSVLIEGSIARFALEVYRAVRHREDAAVARRYVWLAVVASAAANVTHSPAGGPVGSALFATFPILGAAVIEFDAAVLRRRGSGSTAAAHGRASSLTRLVSAAVARLWAFVAAWLGVDVDARDTDVERVMRIRKAGRLMYALRVAANKDGRFAAWRARRLEARAQRARATAGIPADVDAHRAVLAHMRMLAATRAEALGEAAYEPWSPVPVLDCRQDAGQDQRQDGRQDDTHAARSLRPPVSGPVTSGDDRTGCRTTGSGPSSSRRTNGDRKNRTRPRTNTLDVSDLMEDGQAVYLDLHRAGEPLNRDRFLRAMREAGNPVSTDRATALWRELRNGHAPARD